MRFYLASSFKYAAYCNLIHKCLKGLKHNVPDIWWNIDGKLDTCSDKEWYQKSYVKAIAARHWKAIDSSDALILVGNPENESIFSGANIEVGYAIAKNIPVFTFGKIKRSGMYSPVIHCDSISELINAVSIFSLEER